MCQTWARCTPYIYEKPILTAVFSVKIAPPPLHPHTDVFSTHCCQIAKNSPSCSKVAEFFFAEEVDSGQIFTKGAEKYFFLLQILAGKEVYFINFRIRDTIFLDSSWFRLKNINKNAFFTLILTYKC